jgi:putative ATP-dependent endonuclease of OLD family
LEDFVSIKKVRVEGFRLLSDVEITMEPTSTIIVGRNNSGKTSLTDVFDKFTGESEAKFRLEDFSAGSRSKFVNASKLRSAGADPQTVLAALPIIALTIEIGYDPKAKHLGPLAPFIIDLDVGTTTAVIRIEYSSSLASLHTLLDVPSPPEGMTELDSHFLRSLRNTLSSAYSLKVSAIDPTDEQNKKSFEGTASLKALLKCDFVRAQRTLDHAKNGDTNVIGKLLSTIFKTATNSTAAVADQELAIKLKSSVEDIERAVQNDFDVMLKGLLPAMEVLGFPSLNDTDLRPETSLNVEALLSDHTKVVYAGSDGVYLPEGYNGLGTRNLIYMLLQLENYHKSYRAAATRPFGHLIFIEEPEAHLHPQMQEVFINQLNAAIKKLSASYPDEPAWRVQFIITTHSPHVANAASFESVRYFLNDRPDTTKPRQTKIKDFKKGVSAISPEDQEFLHQYMTLTKCDLYFADKAVLVEGTTERLLMPRLCEIVDLTLDEKFKLARQYVTFVEVGGAYAHIFYPLLDFLELKTLVVTDLDSVHAVPKENKKGHMVTKWEKCPVGSGTQTSNIAIREWFRPASEKSDPDWQSKPPPHLTLAELAGKTNEDKQDGYRRLAYQIPENEGSTACARSYEDALVLANPDRFVWANDIGEAEEAWNIAKDLPKSETALRFAIREKDWVVPRYIREGLIWLSAPPPPPEISTVSELLSVTADVEVL